MFQPEFLGVGTVGERGQVSIPSEARKRCGLKAGKKLVFLSMHDGGFVVLKADRLEAVFGEMAKHAKHIAKLVKQAKE